MATALAKKRLATVTPEFRLAIKGEIRRTGTVIEQLFLRPKKAPPEGFDGRLAQSIVRGTRPAAPGAWLSWLAAEYKRRPDRPADRPSPVRDRYWRATPVSTGHKARL